MYVVTELIFMWVENKDWSPSHHQGKLLLLCTTTILGNGTRYGTWLMLPVSLPFLVLSCRALLSLRVLMCLCDEPAGGSCSEDGHCGA